MKPMLTTNMMQATRLTRQGRLVEALALLRGRGAREPSAHDDEAASTARGPARPDLAETLRVLKERLGHAGASPLCGMTAPRTPTVAVPEGASFNLRTFSGPAGRRDYKLYVPSGYNGQTLPLLVMLHGCTQSPDDFAAGTEMNTLAEEHLFLVAYPAQPSSANANKCWNWFNVNDQLRGHGEPSLIAGLTSEIVDEFPVDRSRVFIAGLSAGGAAAAIMGSQYPELYAAIGVHSGLAAGAASDMPSAFAAMRQGGARKPTRSRQPLAAIVFHGDADATVNPVNGEQVIQSASGDAVLQEFSDSGRSPAGVAYTRTAYADAAGAVRLEHWVLHGVGHAWSGGSAAGSYTEPRGPNASREMVRFFLNHPRTA